MQTIHRPGPYKQQNKTHKQGRHRSNRSIDTENKGKVNVKLITKKAKHDMNRRERRNKALQFRKKKRDEVIAKRRHIGSQINPPFLIVVVPVCADNDPLSLLESIKTCDKDAIVTINQNNNYVHISSPCLKQRFTFIVPPADLYSILDAAKVADAILLLYSLEEVIDEGGEQILSSLLTQGLPSTVHVAQGLKNVHVNKKAEVKKNISKILERRFPSEKVHFVDKPQDYFQILRQIACQKQRTLTLQNRHPHLLVEYSTFEINSCQETGTLKVSGYLRGQPLDVNSLIHIPGWGDFQMSQIDTSDDPHPLIQRRNELLKRNGDMNCETTKVLQRADPVHQESLQCENIPDEMDGEQTWPTELEIAEAEEANKKKITKKVPKGTSEYQASWILESDEEDDDVNEDGYNDDDADLNSDLMAVDEDISNSEESDYETVPDDDEYDKVTVTEDTENYDEKMNMEEERNTLVRFREEKNDEMFPDEMDTPTDCSARVRFQRYRGLKSFHNSPWDLKENLPADYAKIFQFENFNRTKKRVLSEERNGALPGWFITVHIINVPKDFIDKHSGDKPLVIYGLFPHEQKMSVLNFVLKRNSSFTEPIKSKERLIFHVGYRRFSACPIYSSHTSGTKHKYERFFRNGTVVVATVYAPIIFPPASVLLFTEQNNGLHELVATGSVLSVNPDRVIVKRVVLSGHPFKINRKSAVVRYMFFNRDDIFWFKPIELRTKYGRRGHIKDALGTHGHMKCNFDKQLKSQDVVLMNLYKRVYPKWSYDTNVSMPISLYNVPIPDEIME